MLREAGWALDKPKIVNIPVTGMPNREGEGYLDYVLWGKDRLRSGLVEAKRTQKMRECDINKRSSYADCLETKYKRRPLIFTQTATETWFSDNLNYPAP